MFHIIINPASKSGKGIRIWSQLEPQLIEKKCDYLTYFTMAPGDTTAFVKNIVTHSPEEMKNIIILGGDGTVNEALQGVSDFSKVQFGYIPTGSSNDLARDLKLEKDPVLLLSSIIEEKELIQMDMGTITYNDGSFRNFAVSSGIGFDAAVCKEALCSPMKQFFNKIGLGKLTYLGIALKQLFGVRKAPCQIVLDNDVTLHLNQLLFAAAMVHKYEGGGFKFAPAADYSDGALDLCVVGDVSPFKALFILPFAFSGKHLLFSCANSYHCEKATIKTQVPFYVHTDGEVKKAVSELTFTCQKNCLTFII